MGNWEKAIYVVNRIKERLKTEYPTGLPAYSGYNGKAIREPIYNGEGVLIGYNTVGYEFGDSGIIQYLDVSFSNSGHTINLKYIFNPIDIITKDGQELSDARRNVITLKLNSPSYPSNLNDGIIIDDNPYTYNSIRSVSYTSTSNLETLFYNQRLYWKAFVCTSNNVWVGIENWFGEYLSGQRIPPKITT